MSYPCQSRISVDPSQLEKMLQVTGKKGNRYETAELFLQRIMSVTCTQISWPVQLRNGTKPKKDPYIMISGNCDSVFKAKEKIMEVLDRKRNRVTMKMDVSHTEHSQIIGKGGSNVRRIMESTGCHIHFPDVNRRGTEKSNKVSLSGTPLAVERARAIIRESLPFVISFEMPLTGHFQPILDPKSPELKLIQSSFDFTVSFPKHSIYSSTVAVRCNQRQFARHREGILFLMDYLSGKKMHEVPVCIELEVLPPHQNYVAGQGAINMQHVMQRTGATISFPLPKKSAFVIFGPIDSVFMAWQNLMNFLPLVLIFDLGEGQDVDASETFQLLEEHHINVLIKPKPKINIKTVILTAAEQASKCLLQARQYLLKLKKLNFPPDKNEINFASSILSQSTDVCHTDLTLNSISPKQEVNFQKWLSPVSPPPYSNRRYSVPEEQNHNFFDLKSISSADVIASDTSRDDFSNLSSNDFKEDHGHVGCERKANFQELLSTDYEYKKILATKAMQRSIDSEQQTQVPSSLWAGYGFSRSTPSTVLKQNLQDCGMYHSCIPNSKEHEILAIDKSPNEICQTSETWTSNPLNDIVGKSPVFNNRGDGNFSSSNYFEEVFRKPSLSISPEYDLPQLLCHLGLSSHIDTFVQQEIDFSTFLSMSDQDLYNLGIAYGPRKKMYGIISEINQQFSKTCKGFKPFDAAPGAGRDLSRCPSNEFSKQGLQINKLS